MSLKASSWKALTALAVAGLLALGPAGGALASEGDTPEGAASQDPTTNLVVEETTSAPEQAAEPDSSEPVVEAPVAPAPDPAPKPVTPPKEAPTTNDSAAPDQGNSTDKPSEVNANAPPKTTSPEPNKPGKLQPVWCHKTGNDWKAQLGAAPSGNRNEAFPLMGDFGWGTTDGGQTLAHDRSTKLDAACGDQTPVEPEEPLLAKVWYTMTDPTCDAPSQIEFHVENATWAHEPDRTPGTHKLVFNANEGALFQGDLEEWTVTYAINPKLESQSTDPDGACYVPPVSVEPELVKAEFTSVCKAEGGAAMLNIDIQVKTDRQYLTVWVNYTKKGSGDIPTGVTLDEVTAPEGIKAYWASEPFEPGEYTFDIQFDGVTVETVDVTVPECDEPEQPLVAHVYYEMSAPTCEAPSKVTFFMENAIWAHEPDQSVGTHTLEFDAVEGAMFPGDMATKSVTYTILPKLESQSTDPDGACYVPPTEEPLLAKVWYTMTDPTCDAPSQIEFHVENATWAHEPDRTPGTHKLVFNANEGALFQGDLEEWTVTYAINPKLESQSTDPDGACYVPPTEEPENPTDPEDPENPVKPEEPTKHEKPVNNTKTDATHLATTGPADTNGLMTVGLLSLVAGAYLVLRKKFAAKAAK